MEAPRTLRRRRATPLLVDAVSVGAILLFWVLVAEATTRLVAVDPVGLAGWADVPTVAFVLAGLANAAMYLGLRVRAAGG